MDEKANPPDSNANSEKPQHEIAHKGPLQAWMEYQAYKAVISEAKRKLNRNVGATEEQVYERIKGARAKRARKLARNRALRDAALEL